MTIRHIPNQVCGGFFEKNGQSYFILSSPALDRGIVFKREDLPTHKDELLEFLFEALNIKPN